MGVKVREKVKGSGCFWVFINHQGKRVSRQVGSKATAEKVAEQIQAKLTLGQDALPKPKPKLPTLEQYYQHIRRTYLQTATRPTTLESYRSSFEIHILPKLGSKRLDELSKVHIRNLIAGLVRADLAKASIQVIVAKLCAVLNHAVEDELILRNPATKCAKFYKQARIRNREIQPLNPEKAALFLKTICNREISRRYYPLFLTALHTGMRSSELAALQWGDIDFNGKFLTVRRTYVEGRIQPTTKNDKIRRVDLSDALLRALYEHKKAMRQEWLKKGHNKLPEWVFANEEGNPPDMRNLKNRHFKKCLDAAGLRSIRLHDLRHSYASLLIQNGEPLAYIRDQLGHSSIKMTVDVYGHLEPGRNRQAVNKLPTIKDAPAEAMKKASNS